MLALRSTLDRALAERNAYEFAFRKLVERINKLGGEEFLKRGEARLERAQLSDDEVRKLLQLCHPDKHGGKPLAEEMTAKLLALRSSKGPG
jgi:hypothetical protein